MYTDADGQLRHRVSWRRVRSPPPLLYAYVCAYSAKWTWKQSGPWGIFDGMANTKLIRPCRKCGISREHYTRRGNGRVVSPCCECQIAKSKERQDAIRDDPTALDRQRAEWKRIKKQQRLVERGEVRTHTAEPEIQPASIRMVERRRRRRKPTTPEVSLPVSPSRRRRHRSIAGDSPARNTQPANSPQNPPASPSGSPANSIR